MVAELVEWRAIVSMVNTVALKPLRGVPFRQPASPCCTWRQAATASLRVGSPWAKKIGWWLILLSVITMSRGGDEAHNYVPKWDGRSDTFAIYEDDIALDMMGTDMGANVSLAARVAQRLQSASRRIALNLKGKLHPLACSGSSSDGNGGRQPTSRRSSVAEAHKLGIQRLLPALKKDLQPGKQDRKGDKLSTMLGTERHHRRRGQRIVEHNTFFREFLHELTDLGVVLDDDVAGYCYLRSIAISSGRRERLLGATGEDGFPMMKLMEHASRMFKDIQLTEKAGFSGKPQSRHVNVTAAPAPAAPVHHPVPDIWHVDAYYGYPAATEALATGSWGADDGWDAGYGIGDWEEEEWHEDPWQPEDQDPASVLHTGLEERVQDFGHAVEEAAAGNDGAEGIETLQQIDAEEVERALEIVQQATEALTVMSNVMARIRPKAKKGGKGKGKRRFAKVAGKLGKSKSGGRCRKNASKADAARLAHRKANSSCKSNLCKELNYI